MDGDGSINYEEFLSGLRDDLTPRRAAMVEKAYNILDVNGNGTINFQDVGEMYDVSCHKDFIEGKKTKE